MLPRVFAQSSPRLRNAAMLPFNIAQSRVQRWSIRDSEIPFLSSYRNFGCTRSNFAAPDTMSLDCNSMSHIPLPKDCSAPQLLIPSTYVPMTSSWRPFKSVSNPGGLCQGSLLLDLMHHRMQGCSQASSDPCTIVICALLCDHM